ncbi:MAG: class I SAM-dependent methyltransferase [Elusimicrobiota bacterium]
MSGLRLLWHRFWTRRKLERIFSRGADAFGFEVEPYERRRLEAMERMLREASAAPLASGEHPRSRDGGPLAAARGKGFRHVLELGCAEGAFTKRLCELAERVSAVDLSPLALERASGALSGREGVRFFEADLLSWEPAEDARFDAVVAGDVLYYLDKPLVHEAFEGLFSRLAGWVEPGGLVLLAHGYLGDAERSAREGYRERLVRLGMRLITESIVEGGGPEGKSRCLLSLLRKPAPL